MLRYMTKRIILMLFTFVIIIFLVFIITKSMPDNYVPPMDNDDTAYQLLRIREGWDRPPVEQFFLWIRNIFMYGNFGWSQVLKEDVSVILFSKIPATLRLNIIPMLLSIPIGITLGIIAALKKNKLTDHVISTAVIIFISVPTFILSFLLQYNLVFRWEILPTPYVATDQQWLDRGFWFGVKSYIIPIFVITIGSVAAWARSIRAELSEQITSDYMLLARSKGLSHRSATFRHALKNAMVPFAPAIFSEFIGLIYGSMILEKIFRVEGVGGVYLTAFNTRDYPLLMINVCFYTIIGLSASILADLSYSLLDPRIRVGSGKQS